MEPLPLNKMNMLKNLINNMDLCDAKIEDLNENIQKGNIGYVLEEIHKYFEQEKRFLVSEIKTTEENLHKKGIGA